MIYRNLEAYLGELWVQEDIYVTLREASGSQGSFGNLWVPDNNLEILPGLDSFSLVVQMSDCPGGHLDYGLT